MKIDLYTKVVLTVIAISLFSIATRDYVQPAWADDNYIIQRILYCLDGSRIRGDKFVTYCNG